MSVYSDRRDPKKYFLDEREYKYVEEHDAFYHAGTKFWYVIEHSLFWSSGENLWYSYDNDQNKWNPANPPRPMCPGPWNKNNKSRRGSSAAPMYRNNFNNHQSRSSNTFNPQPVQQPQLGIAGNLTETKMVVNVASLLIDLKPELTRFKDRKETLNFLVKKIRAQFGVSENKAKQLYQQARKKFKRSNQDTLAQQAQQLHAAATNASAGSHVQPALNTASHRAHPTSHRSAYQNSNRITMDGVWAYTSDKGIKEQFWHIKEVDDMFVGVGTWNGYEHHDCILRGFRKKNGDLSLSINYSFRKPDEEWATNHIAKWKGKIESKTKLRLENGSNKLVLEKCSQNTETSQQRQRKKDAMQEMKDLMGIVKSNTTTIDKLYDTILMIKILGIPDDNWIIERWSLRAQQALTKSKRLNYKIDTPNRKSQDKKFADQIAKGIIKWGDSKNESACAVCAIQFKDPNGTHRLRYHALYDKTHKLIAKPFLEKDEDCTRIPSLKRNFANYCRMCNIKVKRTQVFAHVHSEVYQRHLANYKGPSKTKPVEVKKRKLTHAKEPDPKRRKSSGKKISEALKAELKLEIMFIVRESWATSTSRMFYWFGVSTRRALSKLKNEFPEIKNWEQRDLEDFIENLRCLVVSSDGSKILYNERMSVKEQFQEFIASRIFKKYNDDCRTKQERLEWRGIDTNKIYKDKDVKDTARDLGIRNEEKFKNHIYANAKKILGIHMERDTDQKNVKDFTIWVRFKETRRTRNYKENHLKTEMQTIRKRVRSAKQCREEFKKGIEESLISKDRITLKDTFTLRRIKVPAKAKGCAHTQCFDLESYLKMKLFQRDVYKTKKGSSGSSEKVKVERWKCPVCNKNARRNDLYVDGFWNDILNDPATKDADSVFIMPDCTYQVEELELGEQSDSDEEMTQAVTKKPSVKKTNQPESVMISLISDDEDEPPPKKTPEKNAFEKPVAKKPVPEPNPKPKVVMTFPKVKPKIIMPSEAEKPKLLVGEAAKPTDDMEVEKTLEETSSNAPSSKKNVSKELEKSQKKSPSPERYPPPSSKETTNKENEIKLIKLNKDDDFDFLERVLANLHLEHYMNAFKTRRFGLSDLLRGAARNKEMPITLRGVMGRQDRIVLMQHAIVLCEDPEALLDIIGVAPSTLTTLLLSHFNGVE